MKKSYFIFFTVLFCKFCNAQDSPLMYKAISDTLPYAEVGLPAIGNAGYKFTDPVFGTPIIRVTDSMSRPDAISRPWHASSSSEQNVFNANSTMFYVNGPGGESIFYNLNKTNFTTSRVGNTSNGTGGTMLLIGEGEFSRTYPNIIYGVGGPYGRTLLQYDFSSNSYTELLNLDTIVASLPISSIGSALSVSKNEILSVAFGATQDFHHYILVFNKNTNAYTILNTLNGDIKRSDGTTGYCDGVTWNWPIHNARINLTGEYVVITATDGTSPYKLVFWDTKNNVAYGHKDTVAPYIGGHKVGGYNYFINGAGVTDGQNVVMRSFTDLTNYSNVINPTYPLPTQFCNDTHFSWNNARPDSLAPVIVSSYRYDIDSLKTWRATTNEIYAIRTDGIKKQFWRFAHHHSSIYDGYDNFDYQPHVHVSGDGRYAIFNSNWKKTLGTYNITYKRQDVFLVKLDTTSTLNSIKEDFTKMNFNVAPNPANNNITINFMLKNSENIKIELYDVLGQKIKTVKEKYFPLGEYHEIVDISSISPGIYFIILNEQSKKIVIN